MSEKIKLHSVHSQGDCNIYHAGSLLLVVDGDGVVRGATPDFDTAVLIALTVEAEDAPRKAWVSENLLASRLTA